jgi:hypothetical protein
MAETVAVIERVLLRGSSFPSLVTTASRRRWVMKLAGAGQGRRGLACEFIASRLARMARLHVPDVVILELSSDLPWMAGTDEFYETVQRSTGMNLGVAFVADARDVPAAELTALPADFLHRLGAVDALLQNHDRRAANPNIIRDPAGTPWAIDFGACLLIDRIARGDTALRLALPSSHLLAERPPAADAVRAVAAELAAADVGALITELPAAWLADLGVSPQTLTARLRAYLAAAASADGVSLPFASPNR